MHLTEIDFVVSGGMVKNVETFTPCSECQMIHHDDIIGPRGKFIPWVERNLCAVLSYIVLSFTIMY
jgi:hypothetical protein